MEDIGWTHQCGLAYTLILANRVEANARNHFEFGLVILSRCLSITARWYEVLNPTS